MLVTLGTNQSIAAGSTQTFTYSPQSLQRVFLRLEDATGGEALGTAITVQIGSKVVCNGVQAWGLSGITNLTTGHYNNGNDTMLNIDFGSHELTTNENIYVSVYSASVIDAVDCSCIVDEPGLGTPVRYTQYSDTTFTADNALLGLMYASARTVVDEDDGNMETRTAVASSAPTLISCSSWFKNSTFSDQDADNFGIVFQNSVPLRTSVNYTTTGNTNRILTVEQDSITANEVRQGKNSQRVANAFAGK